MLPYLLKEGADLFVRSLGSLVLRLRKMRDLGLERASFLLPFDSAAVKQLRVRKAEQPENPEGVGGPPVVLVAVEDDGRVLVDPLVAEELLQLSGRHIFA